MADFQEIREILNMPKVQEEATKEDVLLIFDNCDAFLEKPQNRLGFGVNLSVMKKEFDQAKIVFISNQKLTPSDISQFELWSEETEYLLVQPFTMLDSLIFFLSNNPEHQNSLKKLKLYQDTKSSQSS